MQMALSEVISEREILDARLAAAYKEDLQNVEPITYMAGQEIPNDPREFTASGKRKLPPPIGIEEGGDSPS